MLNSQSGMILDGVNQPTVVVPLHRQGDLWDIAVFVWRIVSEVGCFQWVQDSILIQSPARPKTVSPGSPWKLKSEASMAVFQDPFTFGN